MTTPPRSGSRFFWIGLFVIALIVAIFSPLLPLGAPFGYLAAKRDGARGLHQLYLPMENTGWQAEARKTIKEKYGIEIISHPPSSMQGGDFQTYEEAYNHVQRQAILEKFGRDVVQQALRDARNNAPTIGAEGTAPDALKIQTLLARLKDGDPVSALEKAIPLFQYASAHTPNLPQGEEHIIYYLPEGDLHVMTKKNRRGKTILSPPPFLIANDTPIPDRVSREQSAWDEHVRQKTAKPKP